MAKAQRAAKAATDVIEVLQGTVYQPPPCTTFNAFSALTTQSFYFWLIVGIVGLLAYRRFETHRLKLQKFDPPIPNRNYTTSFRYYFAGIVYALTLVSLYAVIVLSASNERVLEGMFSLFGPIADIAQFMEGAMGADSTGASEAVRTAVGIFNNPETGLCHEKFNVLYPTKAVIRDSTYIADALAKGKLDPKALLAIETLDGRLANILIVSFGLFILFASTPIFNRADQRFRDWLNRFAGVPLQARILADQLVAGIEFPKSLDPRYAELAQYLYESRLTDPRVFQSLYRLVTETLMEGDERTLPYREYFQGQNGNLLRLRERFELLHGHINSDDPALRDAYNREMRLVIDDIAMLLACGILKIEGDEVRSARALQRFGIANVVTPRFSFSVKEIIIGVVATAVVAAVNLALASVVIAALTGPGDDGAYHFGALAGTASALGTSWTVISITVYFIPLLIAGAVVTYLSETPYRGNTLTTGERASFLVLTFALSFIVACMALLLYSLMQPRLPGEVIKLDMLFPWGVAPALLAAVYVFVSDIEYTKSVKLNVAIDGAIFFVVASTATFVAASFSYAAQPYEMTKAIEPLTPYLSASGEHAMVTFGYGLSSGLLAAVLGSGLARSSRQRSEYIEDTTEAHQRVVRKLRLKRTGA